MITIPLSRERHDLTAREFASHVADSDLLLAQNHRATIPMLSDPAHAEVFDREAVRDPVLRSFAAAPLSLTPPNGVLSVLRRRSLMPTHGRDLDRAARPPDNNRGEVRALRRIGHGHRSRV